MDKVTLKIPRPLYNRIKQVIEPSGFSSVNEFVVYVLRDLVSQLTAAEREELARESGGSGAGRAGDESEARATSAAGDRLPV